MSLLSDRINSLQVSSGKLKKDIAESIGISVMAYYRYETGKREPVASILASLADCFDVSTDYLLGRTDNPNSHKN